MGLRYAIKEICAYGPKRSAREDERVCPSGKSGTKILSKYLPALEVGGDFYSVKELDSSHIGLIIGDVSGHGISAALSLHRSA